MTPVVCSHGMLILTLFSAHKLQERYRGHGAVLAHLTPTCITCNDTSTLTKILPTIE